MADCGKDHAALAEIVGPARGGLSTQVFPFGDVGQAIDILTLQEDVLRIFVIGDEVLFVVDDEVLHTTRDRMLLVHHRHLEWAQGRVIDVRPAHHLAIVRGREGNVTAVVEGVKCAPSLHEPLDGGTLLHRERAARAAYTQAAEQYRSTVLTALQNVADTLHALQQDADGLKSAAAARDAATVTLELTRKQLDAGYTNYLALLSAQQAYQQALITLVQAQSNRYSDTAALFQALGGGWWNRPDLPKN